MRLLSCFLLFASIATADQAAYISEQHAEKAAKLLTEGTEVKHFCEPCHDAEPRAEFVEKAEVKYTGSESFYEVHLNGTPVDLAYLFVPVEGVWTNLALHLGLEVRDVSLVLGEGEVHDEEDLPAASDFPRLHLLGKVGERQVLVELSRFDHTLSGTYQYLHVGDPIYLEGTLEKDGKVTLSEAVGEEKTGQFIGKLSSDLKTFTGKWVNPDGQRSVDFSLARFAVGAQEENHARIPGVRNTSVLEYPVFTLTPAAEALNTFLQDYVQQRHRMHVREIVAAAAEDLQLEVPEESPTLAQSLDLGGYQFHCYDGRFLSLSFSEYVYSGGAHGNSATHTLNFRLEEDGKLKQLTLKELFKEAEAALRAVSSALIADLKQQEAQWIVDGQTKEFGWDDLGAWTIDAKGLTCYFDPYAVGPYAQGMFIVTLPLNEIAEHLNTEIVPQVLLSAVKP